MAEQPFSVARGGAADSVAPASLLQRTALIPHTATLRPVGGVYLLVLGMAFLLLPQGQLGTRLEPIWLQGYGLTAAGLLALWLPLLRLQRAVEIALTLVMAISPLAITAAYISTGTYPPAITLGLLTLGMLLAPWSTTPAPEALTQPDALGLIFGLSTLAQGWDFLRHADRFAPIFAPLPVPVPILGAGMCVAGGLVILAQIALRSSRWLFMLAHFIGGVLVIALQVATAVFVNPLYWLLGTAALVRGGTMLLLPWISGLIAAADRAAFRPRVAAALLTAAIVPVAVALPVVINATSPNTNELNLARQIAFASTLLVMLLAGSGGWLLAGSLTRSLRRLMHAVDRVATGQQATLPVMDDVTEVRALSQSVQQMTDTLAARAAERKTLYEREQQARKQAQEAVQVRDAFLSIAAHELRTPLTALLGHAQLMARRAARSDATTERDQRAITTIVDQASRLNEMITTLLDISRLEHGQLTVDRAPLDLAALLQRISTDAAPLTTTHHITCVVATPLPVYGDEMRLAQVFGNLLSNAVKYSPQGGTVRLHAAIEAEQVVVSITDQGIGIPAAALPHLFERFYRASNVEAKGITGIGVGLYVVKEIITRHDGTITVDSTEGKGSTFTVRLPLLQAAS